MVVELLETLGVTADEGVLVGEGVAVGEAVGVPLRVCVAVALPEGVTVVEADCVVPWLPDEDCVRVMRWLWLSDALCDALSVDDCDAVGVWLGEALDDSVCDRDAIADADCVCEHDPSIVPLAAQHTHGPEHAGDPRPVEPPYVPAGQATGAVAPGAQ